MTRRLHIAISARALSLPVGGVKEYVTAMIRAVTSISSPHRFSIYYADCKYLGSTPSATEVHLSARHKFLWDHWALSQRLNKDQPDVVWFPHNVSSLGLSLPTVVSVMDMLYFPIPEFPGQNYGFLDSLYMRTFITRSLRRASRIMTISDWTAHDIERLLDIPRTKIRTIHLAPSQEFRVIPNTEREAVRSTYNLRQPFFLYAGSLSGRKNVAALIEAFGQVHTEIPHHLVLVGSGRGTVPEGNMQTIIKRYGIQDRVHQLGIVPHDDIIALYNAANAFVFPSLYEGFGLPPLEAFACGCPVVSSTATALAEVVGDAALTFDPRDVLQLAGHLKAVATDDGLRERLIAKGFERVKLFSYQPAAKQLLELLEEAAST